MSEWNLSDKIEWKPIRYAIPTEDIQEFIRRLKTDLLMQFVVWFAKRDNEPFEQWVNSRIDKLAGEKLIEETVKVGRAMGKIYPPKLKAEDDELLKEALKDIEKINKWAKEKLLKKEKKLR